MLTNGILADIFPLSIENCIANIMVPIKIQVYSQGGVLVCFLAKFWVGCEYSILKMVPATKADSMTILQINLPNLVPLARSKL